MSRGGLTFDDESEFGMPLLVDELRQLRGELGRELEALQGRDLSRRGAVAGRAGNLLVIQHKSAIGYDHRQGDALRTLGLKGPGTASLLIDSPTVNGNIEAVRHLIRVVQLSDICYKGFITEHIEKLQYGSATKPAELTRDRLGNYFAYESSRGGLLLMWGTELALDDCLASFDRHFATQTVEDVELSTLVSSVLVDGEQKGKKTSPATFHEPYWSIRAKIAESPEGTLLARLAVGGVEFGWKAEHEPFDDMEITRSEIQLYGKELDLLRAYSLAMDTASPEFIDGADLTIDIRRWGRRRIVPFGGTDLGE